MQTHWIQSCGRVLFPYAFPEFSGFHNPPIAYPEYMLAGTSLMTVEEFRRLPKPTDGTELELHEGEVVRMTIPKFAHQHRAKRIAKLLEAITGSKGEVFV